MKKTIISFSIAIMCLVISCCIPGIRVHADDDMLLRPVGGVAAEEFIMVEWDGPDIAPDSKSGDIPDPKSGEPTADLNGSLPVPNGTRSRQSDGSGTYGYETLSSVQKTIYDDLKQDVEAFILSDLFTQDLNGSSATITTDTVFTDGVICTEDDIRYARTAFRYDNPQYYFLNNYSVCQMEDSGKAVRISQHVDSVYYSYTSRQTADKVIGEIGGRWISELRQLMADDPDHGTYLAAVRAHDLIINEIDYAYDNNNNAQTAWWAHNIAGVFTGQGVVCEGYARAYQYLLNMCGIDNIYIVGQAGSGRDSEGHAWNCVKFGNEWYPIDVTWDDTGSEREGTNDMYYCYFAIPGEIFNSDHDPNNMNQKGMYDIPDFGEDNEYTYYKYFGGYGNDRGTLDDSAAESLFNEASLKQPSFSDYLYFSVKDSSSVSAMLAALNMSTIRSYRNSYFGYVFKIENIVVETPSRSLALSKEEITLDIGESGEIIATIDAGSDDRVSFTLDTNKYCTVSAKGNKAIITGKRNGKATLTATTVGGKISKTCEITIGTGEPEPDGVDIIGTGGIVWQNGAKDYKKIQLKNSIRATSWKDDKGKVKQGKLVWVASDEQTVISFDESKHTVQTKSNSTRGSVSNKGIVTAKTAGTLYVYCCDTGSMKVELFIVDVLAAPSKIFLGDTSGVSDTSDALKQLAVPVSCTERVYISPVMKDGSAADDTNEFTVSVAKTEQKKYVSVSEVMTDKAGNKYFEVTALDIDRSKGKAVKVKLNIVNKQSGKKATLTVTTYNPIVDIAVEGPTGKALAQKGDSITLTLKPETMIEGNVASTDKLKIYIGQTSVDLDENKVTKDSGATVKMKFDKKTLKITLTASKDCGKTAVIAAVVTNPQTRESDLFEIATVAADGIVNISQ